MSVRRLSWVLRFLSLLLVFPTASLAASLPKATLEILEKLKLDPAILQNADKELRVPKPWEEAAKKEGRVRILSGKRPSDMRSLYAPFKERYPFITVEFTSVTREVRDVKTLSAYKSGRVVADMIDSVGGQFHLYREAGALENLLTIPTVENLPKEAVDPEGLWIGVNSTFYCIAYNTRLVRKEELPKRWEDLLTNPRWRGGNLALGNRASPWMTQVWKAKGERWSRDFLTKLFTEVKPQLRKEGLVALPELLAAGEFHAVIPAGSSIVARLVAQGAPVGYSCPEPVPVNINNIVLLRGSPYMNASKIFINWLLSKEGQLSEHFVNKVAPLHRDLQRPEFVSFIDQAIGKERSYQDTAAELQISPKLEEFWNELWLRGGRTR